MLPLAADAAAATDAYAISDTRFCHDLPPLPIATQHQRVTPRLRLPSFAVNRIDFASQNNRTEQ